MFPVEGAGTGTGTDAAPYVTHPSAAPLTSRERENVTGGHNYKKQHAKIGSHKTTQGMKNYQTIQMRVKHIPSIFFPK